MIKNTYETLSFEEKRTLIDAVMKKTGMHEGTVRSWFGGFRTPQKMVQKFIAKRMDVPRKELFPPKDKKL